ncbi:hypothetical protein Tco_1129313 [Tanacetum coccineum]
MIISLYLLGLAGSLIAFCGMVLDGSIIPSDAMRPAVTASVTPTPDVETLDSMFGLNLRTRPPHVRYVVSLDSSLHSDSYSKAASLVRSVADAPVVTVAVTTTIDANVDAGSKAKDGAEVRMRAEHTLEKKNELEDKCAGQANLLSERDTKIAHLKSLLSLKESEATKAISLRSQLIALEAADVSKIEALESAAASKEVELTSISSQVAKLTTDLSGFQLSRDELNSKVASLESERYCLVTQRSSMESAFEFFKGQVKKMQEEQVGVLIDHVAAIDFDFIEMALHMDAEFYPRYLTTIARRRQGHRSCYRQRHAGWFSGRYRTWSGRKEYYGCCRLEAHKDASMADIMDRLRSESPTIETSEARPPQPSLDELMIPIHQLKDQKGATVCRLSLTDSIRPLVEPLSSRVLTGEASSSAIVTVTTALATTFAQTCPIPARPSTEVLPSFKIILEEEELDTTPEHALAP